MTKMRHRYPDEPFWSAWIVRPTVWMAFQLSAEARFIRRHKRRS